jgi:NADH-quinone oxidoreductase subunit J
MPLNLLNALFIFNAVVILGAAICSVTVRNLIHAAMWMVLSFFSIAILFVFMGMGFFAVIQVAIYIGAIAVLILFAIMLTRRSMQEQEDKRLKNVWAALLAVGCVLAVLVTTLQQLPAFTQSISSTQVDEMVPALGRALTEPAQYGLLFELASVLLLAALIGAIYLAYDRKKAEGERK